MVDKFKIPTTDSEKKDLHEKSMKSHYQAALGDRTSAGS
jgi:hypothetical protein